MEFSLGYLNRDFKLPPSYEESIQSNEDLAAFRSRFINGNFLPVSLNLVHDSVLFAPFGPYHGTRYRLSASHAFGISDKFTSFTNLNLDFRNYIDLTSDIVLASRLSINHSFGESPNIYFFGGTDTLRGYNYLELVGNTTFFGNVEIRFPLIDRIDFPIGIRLGGIRGVLFFNLGGAFFEDENFQFFEKDAVVLKDAIASYGAGMSFNIIGLEFHWDAAQKTNFRDTSDWTYSFWIGYSF
jgi:outer membrane protein assembly factor BamA